MEDVYDSLDNYCYEDLQKENKCLKSKIDDISDKLSKVQESILQDYNNLSNEYKKLETRYSSLLKTAKAEILRKTQLITRLNTEKDQIIIQHLSNNKIRYPFKAKQNNIGQEQNANKENAKTKPEQGVDVANKDSYTSQNDVTSNEAKSNDKDKTQENKPNKTVQPKQDTILGNKKHKQSSHNSEGAKENINHNEEIDKPQMHPDLIRTDYLRNPKEELRTLASPQFSSDGEIHDDETESAKSYEKHINVTNWNDHCLLNGSNSPTYDTRGSTRETHGSRYAKHYGNSDIRNKYDSYKYNRSKSRGNRDRRYFEQKDRRYDRHGFDKNENSRRTTLRSGYNRNCPERRRIESPSRNAYIRSKSREYRSNDHIYDCYDRSNEKEYRPVKHKIGCDEYNRSKRFRAEENARDPFANTVYKKLDKESNPLAMYQTVDSDYDSRTSRSKSQELYIDERLAYGSQADYLIEDQQIQNDDDKESGTNEIDNNEFVLPPLFEDPRLISKKYIEVTDARNIVHITRAVELSIELKCLKYDNTLKHVRPEPKSCLDLDESFINELYMDIDREVQNLSAESGKSMDYREEPIKTFNSDDPPLDTHKVTEEVVDSPINNSDSAIVEVETDPPVSPTKPQSEELPSLCVLKNYIIPKKNKSKDTDKKNLNVEETAKKKRSSAEITNIDQQDHQITLEPNSNRIVGGEVEVLRLEDDDPYHIEHNAIESGRRLIAEDLQLSDDNSNDISNNTFAKDDKLKKCLPTFGQNLRQEDIEPTKGQCNKVKDMKSKFNDLFGETSLITPDDLEISSGAKDNYIISTNCMELAEDEIDFNFSSNCGNVREKLNKTNSKMNEFKDTKFLQTDNIEKYTENKLNVSPIGLPQDDCKGNEIEKCVNKKDSEEFTNALKSKTNELELSSITKPAQVETSEQNVTNEMPPLQSPRQEMVRSDITKADVTIVVKRRRTILRKTALIAR